MESYDGRTSCLPCPPNGTEKGSHYSQVLDERFVRGGKTFDGAIQHPSFIANNWVESDPSPGS